MITDRKSSRKIAVAACVTLVANLFHVGLFAAAEKSAESAVDKTIIMSLHPVIELFDGNGWLQGSAVILVTFLVASLLSWVLFKIISKVVSRTRTDLDDKIAGFLRPPLYYSFLVGGISYGLTLMPLGDSVELLTSRSIKSLGVSVWIIFFIRLASLLLNRVAVLSDKYTFIHRRTVTLFDNVAKVAILGIGIYLIFVIWKIDMTAWLASAGIVGIAVGFAAKDTLSNLFAGVLILADAPYKVGDYVVMDTAGRGKVTNIGLRSTRILTRDDIEVTIPNSVIGNSTIINQSGGPNERMRVRLTLGVAYGTDISLVRETMLAIAREEPQVCKEVPPSVRFRLFGASSLDFELRCWVYHPEQCSRVIDALNSKIYNEFRRLNIEIPYSKQDLYIKGLPSSFSLQAEAKEGSQ